MTGFAAALAMLASAAAPAVEPATTASKPLTAPRAAAPNGDICDSPVLMVVAGPTLDRARMLAYGKAIADSGLYKQLGGYYVNLPQPLASFEGSPPAGYTTLIVRFPCLANAQAFWNSKVYQQAILPLRLNPSAGNYTVTVYPEAPLRADMIGKVGDDSYSASFSAAVVEQAAAGK